MLPWNMKHLNFSRHGICCAKIYISFPRPTTIWNMWSDNFHTWLSQMHVLILRYSGALDIYGLPFVKNPAVFYDVFKFHVEIWGVAIFFSAGYVVDILNGANFWVPHIVAWCTFLSCARCVNFSAAYVVAWLIGMGMLLGSGYVQ